MNEAHGKHYSIKKCIDCEIEYVGGTTSKRCLHCACDDRAKRIKTSISTKQRESFFASLKEKHCTFCRSLKQLEIHHIDKNVKNNDLSNLILLCANCHKKLHGKVYNPLFQRFFKVLVRERLTYEEIGNLFGTTRQNVYNILNKKSYTQVLYKRKNIKV
jgi:hypothetical protein